MFNRKLLQTVIHLRPIQIRYQVCYRVRKILRTILGIKYPLFLEKESTQLELKSWIEKPVSYENDTYTFLNQSESNIHFNDYRKGALWAYNINYMDYLLQPGLDKNTGLVLIDKYINQLPNNPKGLEPYPIALRNINWIKFLTRHSIQSTQYSSSLYAQTKILFDNIEYHLLGNHLLEDAFSLLFGSFYFTDIAFYNKARKIIETELNEQILNDGAHFELSPMYHQIILERLLDCINLFQNNHRFHNQVSLLNLMEGKAQEMLDWLNTITFSNGEIPLLNDSAHNIAPTTQQIEGYAAILGFNEIRCDPSILDESGYRKFTSSFYECIIDIGQIGPSYQPGHSHADTFNFVLNINNEPVIVDTGTSTYSPGTARLNEKGTAAHNTVTVQDENSSDIWSSFRVAGRAKVKVLKHNNRTVIAQHNGYRRFRTKHKREWNFKEKQIHISDRVTGGNAEGKAHFWLSPLLKPKLSGQWIETNNAKITFKNAASVELIPTKIPNGFNQFSNNYKIEVSFIDSLEIIITVQK